MERVDVVISGIGGRFPHSNNIEDFGKTLLAGKSLLEPTTRWNPGAHDTPKNVALTTEYEKFDYTFFGMHSVLTNLTDPITRIAVEIAFEAIIDAGINPSSIRGTNAHVYAGTTQFEPDCAFDVLVNSTGYAIMGRNRCMISNRISYCFNLSGRSCSYDGMNGWVGDGLQLARGAIQAGECDTAIVVGSSLMFFLQVHKNKHELGLLSPDGSLHPFDDQVNGFGRGDAQVAFVVQRADVARRSYGSIVLAQSESQGTLPNWFLSLNEDHFRNFISTLYRKNGLDPNNVKLLEADGLCNKEMVETELNVLDETLNGRRAPNSPLYLGSVKTIVGEGEGAGGLVSLTKLILAMETGIISPTINCRRLNPNIKGLTEGRFKVVTEPTKWEVTPDTLVAVSSLTNNGVVSHVALKANGKTKKADIVNTCPLPYLILISGRNEEIVGKSLKQVTSSPYDPEYLRLTQEVFSPTIDKFEWRGYGFHGQESDKFVIQRENRRPVWFVFSGMGSQWPGMGKELLLFPVVRETLQRLHRVLETKGVDLLNVVTRQDESLFDNILNSFVAITAIQIALTNLLSQLGIKPDGIIGHSVGELGCSYADGCLTEEQTILASYARGIASQKAELIPGLMAAVGLGGDEARKVLPPEVVVACRNSNESCTISGPAEDVKKVVESFQEKGIFVRSVNVSNIAYHSPYIKPAAPYLLALLREIITAPKLRSSKWICTSAPKEKWDTDQVRYCSADYQTNNLLSPVYFEEGSAYIPKNAIIIEIAPHGLLQAILKRSLGRDVVHVPLTRRGVTSPSKYLLEAMGKLFLEGLSPKIWHLYPDVPMPVSRNTPSLVPLIAWEHEEDFKLQMDVIPADALVHEINYFSPSVEVVGLKCLVPSYILRSAWETLANQMRRDVRALPVVFEGVEFYDLIRLEDKGTFEITSTILSSGGGFETSLKDTVIARGTIRILDDVSYIPLKQPPLHGSAKLSLDADDIYAEMRNRCVGIPENMRSISKLEIYPQDWIADVDSVDGDWNSLLTSLFILYQLRNCEDNQVPAYVNHIRRLVINPLKNESNRGVARFHLPASTLIYDGVEIAEVSFRILEKPVARSEPASLRFIPYGETKLEEDSFLLNVVQLCMEKRLTPPLVFKIYDVDNEHSSLAQKLRSVLTSKFSLNSEMTTESRDASIILCASNMIRCVSTAVANENILLLSECGRLNRKAFNSALEVHGLHPLVECEPKKTSKALVAITSKLPPLHPHECEIIKLGPDDKIPLTPTDPTTTLKILVWENGTQQSPNEIFDEVLTVEGAEKFRLVFVMTPHAPPFSLEHPLYSEQLRLNVPVNVYFDGKWGNYRVIPLSTPITGDLKTTIAVQPHAAANGTTEMKLKYVGLNPAQRSLQRGVSESSMGIWDYSGEGSNWQKLMGVASFDNQSGCYVRDPQLMWTVPSGWTLEEAATVPCAYSIAYYALFEFAELRPKESVFITCPLTPVGQAALWISFSLGCEIRVLLASVQERDRLQKIFPNLKSSDCLITKSDSFKGHLKTAFPEGIKVSLSHLTGSRLRACCTCMGKNSRLLQINSEPMHSRDYVGMDIFLKQASIYGVSEKGLLESPVDVKEKVAEWFQKGLDAGVVRPNPVRQRYSSDKIREELKQAKSDDVTKRIVFLQAEKMSGDMRRSSVTGEKSQSVIIGGSKTQWLRIAHCLARYGIKHIVIVREQPSPSLSSRHDQILRREFGADLKELTSPKSGSQLIEQLMKMAPIESVFIFEHDGLSEEVVREIDSKGLTDTQLVFLSKDSTYFTRMSERWARDGLKVKAILGVDDLPVDRVTPLFDWLLSPASPTVSELTGPNFSFRKVELASLVEARLLPVSAEELAELGASIHGKTAPIFKEVPARCTCFKATKEIKPVFYMKGIHGRAGIDVQTVASKLLAPIFEVSLHETSDSLEATANAVVEGILKIQSRGPFNLAGDSIRNHLTLKIARILEEKGFASVVFLMDEGMDDIRDELSLLQKGNKLRSSVLKSCFSEDVVQQDWRCVDWSQLTWPEQISTALSRVSSLREAQRENVVVGLEHVMKSMQHIVEAQDNITLKHSILRSIKVGDDCQEFKMMENRFEHTIPPSKLKNKEISEVLSANLATPVLQLNFDRVKGKKHC